MTNREHLLVTSGISAAAQPLGRRYVSHLNRQYLPAGIFGDGDDLVQGDAGNDGLYGEAGNDTLIGEGGNSTSTAGGDDWMDGGDGADTLWGGSGNDALSAAGGAARGYLGKQYLSPRLAKQFDLMGDTTPSMVANSQWHYGTEVRVPVENRPDYRGGVGADVYNASNFANGSNVLDGKVGADTTAGGAGDDTYLIDNAGDIVIEELDVGTDTVHSTLVSYTLTENVEHLSLTATANQDGTRNALDNIITGTAWANGLAGGEGNVRRMADRTRIHLRYPIRVGRWRCSKQFNGVSDIWIRQYAIHVETRLDRFVTKANV